MLILIWSPYILSFLNLQGIDKIFNIYQNADYQNSKS